MRICDLSHIAAGRFLRMGPPPQAVVRGWTIRHFRRYTTPHPTLRATFPKGGRLLKQANVLGGRVSAASRRGK